jgi:hypothetical protein
MADALDSKSSDRKIVWVQVPPPAGSAIDLRAPKNLQSWAFPHSLAAMFIKSVSVGLIGLFVSAASAWAGASFLQGIVKNPNGQPVKDAEIRIEAKSAGNLATTAKTDANGRYTSSALPVGMYQVTLLVNGAVKASINNAKTRADRPTELNFELKSASVAQAIGSTKKAKHMVWVPPATGTHMGGRWVEVDDGTTAGAGTLNVDKVSAEQLERQSHSMGSSGAPGR